MLTVIETPTFRRTAAAFWSDDVRKVRWSRAGMGKRGAARVVYFVRNEAGEVVLVVAYAKGSVDNLPAAFLNRLKELYDV